MDLIVSGTELLSALGVTPSGASNKDELTSLDDLQEAFHYFFKQGAGAERPFTSGDVFKHVIKVAASLSSAQVQKSLSYINVMCCTVELAVNHILCIAL